MLMPQKPAPKSPVGGLFSAPPKTDAGLSPSILGEAQVHPDPNAAMQLQAGVAGTPLYGGASPRQVPDLNQAMGMISGPQMQAQPTQNAILRTLFNAGQAGTPQGTQGMQKSVAPAPVGVNTIANMSAQQTGQMPPAVGASSPGLPGNEDMQAAANTVPNPLKKVMPSR